MLVWRCFHLLLSLELVLHPKSEYGFGTPETRALHREALRLCKVGDLNIPEVFFSDGGGLERRIRRSLMDGNFVL
jgi:hypothetical protein